MKTTTAVCTLIVQILVLAANGACAGTDAGATLIVCSESLTPAARMELQAQIGALLTAAPADHRLVIVKGTDHTPVINVAIPAGSTRERLRDRTLTQAMGLLRRFLEQASQGGEVQSSQIGIPNLPATYWSTMAGRAPSKIILVGDPIFYDPRYLFWSFRDGSFPSDAALSEPRSGCPFINRNHKKIPDDVQISILSPVEWGSNQQHRDFVTRWLRLACQESLGGKLVRVTNSSSQAFAKSTRDEFETVTPDGRELVGMWNLVEGTNALAFPEPGIRPPQSSLDDNGKSEDRSEQISAPPDPASESNSGARMVQPAFENPSGNAEPSDETSGGDSVSDASSTTTSDASLEKAFPENTSRNVERTDSPAPTDSLESTRETASSERLQTAHRPANPDDSPTSDGNSQSGHPASQPTAVQSPQAVLPAVDGQSESEVTQSRPQTDGDSGKLGDEGMLGDEVLPASLDASIARWGHSQSAAPHIDLEVVLERINTICQDRSFPEELSQSLTQGAKSEQPGHAVIATWTSVCPHADLNLHIADVAVRRDVASSPDGTGRDRIEWGITSSLDCDSWINIYETHRDVDVVVVIIDLKTGSLRNDRKNAGSASDHGRDENSRSTSNAWRKVVLNASR